MGSGHAGPGRHLRIYCKQLTEEWHEDSERSSGDHYT